MARKRYKTMRIGTTDETEPHTSSQPYVPIYMSTDNVGYCGILLILNWGLSAWTRLGLWDSYSWIFPVIS